MNQKKYKIGMNKISDRYWNKEISARERDSEIKKLEKELGVKEGGWCYKGRGYGPYGGTKPTHGRSLLLIFPIAKKGGKFIYKK